MQNTRERANRVANLKKCLGEAGPHLVFHKKISDKNIPILYFYFLTQNKMKK